MTSVQSKAEKLLKEDRVFLLAETTKFEYYICRSFSNKVYSIIYNKISNTYNCNCKNLKEIECSHILSVKSLKTLL